jgi:uncharacterized membrane protein YoaK (UPF0700 family)
MQHDGQAPEDDPANARVAAPSVDNSLGMKLLPAVLSVIAGSTDSISFLGLGGLFTAHITGNLVILAAHVVSRTEAALAVMLSVPVFMVPIGLTRVLAMALETIGLASLRPLRALQFLLLAGFLALCALALPRIDLNEAKIILAVMLGVSAMAVQNALMQISLRGAPPTAVRTSNITHFMMDIGEVLLGRDAAGAGKAWQRARHTWPAIVGFAGDCRLRYRLRSWGSVRGCARSLVPGAANQPRTFRSRIWAARRGSMAKKSDQQSRTLTSRLRCSRQRASSRGTAPKSGVSRTHWQQPAYSAGPYPHSKSIPALKRKGA